jgi:ribosomal protein L7/L12
VTEKNKQIQNMKVILKISEVVVLFALVFGVHPDEVEIVEDTPAESPAVKKTLFETITESFKENFPYMSLTKLSMGEFNDKKIAAIKHLRTLVPGMMLSESKWAIEHWSRWIEFVRVNNRVPRYIGNMFNYPEEISLY